MKLPELLAPAGNMEKLKTAIHYGADAVYLGGEEFSLRRMADNFPVPQLEEAVRYAHEWGRKVYLATNIFPFNSDLEKIARYLRQVSHIPFDACIVSDPGVMEVVREVVPGRCIHLSTQANTTNWRSAAFWGRQGVGRVNLARELTLEDIREIKDRAGVEIEVFVHGAMCISYSGRCLLSSVMTGRNANRGECAHPCRWGYSIVEEKRPGLNFPVEEEGRGTYIFNSRDLCLIEDLPALIDAGVDSLKIEGRMKGIHYLSTVVRIYREALDSFGRDRKSFAVKPEWLSELGKISHRGYTRGFLHGLPGGDGCETSTGYQRSHELVGVVVGLEKDGTARIEVRNRVTVDDVVEFVGRGMANHTSSMSGMVVVTGQGETCSDVAHPNQMVRMRLPFPVEPFDILRRENKGEK